MQVTLKELQHQFESAAKTRSPENTPIHTPGFFATDGGEYSDPAIRMVFNAYVEGFEYACKLMMREFEAAAYTTPTESRAAH